MLPLVEAHRREHTYCTFCPKLCRFACPVSTVQGSETTTPWGKMTSLHHVADGNLPLASEHAATWYACTGCLRCKTFCDHDNEVAMALGAGRAEAVVAGVAPEAARRVIDGYVREQTQATEAAVRVFGDRLKSASAIAFVPGCDLARRAPNDARDALHAVDALFEQQVRVEAQRCCGHTLLEAGDPNAFLAAARRFLEPLAVAVEVVVHDPDCLYALRVIAPRMGLRHNIKLRHISEVAAERLSRLGQVDIHGPVRFHDPCKLGRGLGLYEPPRTVLAHILRRPPDEFAQNRERSECSGGGGLLPLTDPETADAIARDRVAEHQRLGGGTVITACLGAKRQLTSQGAACIDLGALIGQAARA